jgi:hypothetical protein
MKSGGAAGDTRLVRVAALNESLLWLDKQDLQRSDLRNPVFSPTKSDENKRHEGDSDWEIVFC